MSDSSKLLRDDDGFLNRGVEVTRVEAFFDAAFAFAITLMVISIDEIPRNTAELLSALKSVPAFAASFLLIVMFWGGHAEWSRRYGLNDRYSQRITLLLVFLVLVFIYPMRMAFGALFWFASNGWLTTQLQLETAANVRIMFMVFAIAFGSMGTSMYLLYRHAWSVRSRIGLDEVEQLATRHAAWRWAMVPLVSLISLSLSVFLLSDDTTNKWVIGMPGLIFFVLNFTGVAIRMHSRHALRALRET